MAIHLNEITASRPQYLGGGNWELKNLNHITVVLGKNGSGKSLLLRTIRDSKRPQSHYASPERGGEINFRPDFVNEELNIDTRGNKRMRNFALTYREEVVARIQAFLAKRGNQRADTILENPDEMEKILHVLMPDFTFSIRDGNPPYSLLRQLTDQSITNVNDLSSGETEVLVLSLDLLLMCAIWSLENQKQGLLLIDEPDCHLHPDLQQHLAKFLIEIMERYKVQMIIATHSTTLLSALGYHGKDKTSAIYINNSVEVQNAMKFNNYMQELSTCLGGHALMGPLFNIPLMLVEGDDDYKIWSQAPRHGILKVAVIPCNGDEMEKYQKLLENIFQSLVGNSKKASAYMLKDGDKECPPQENFKHVLCLKLNCHEGENLYLTDELLTDMSLTWDQAKQKIKSEASKYGNKAQFLSGVDTWDRKQVDLKNHIQELQEILDSKHVNWAMRLGRVIGSKNPEGQLAEFLGEEVVNALWPKTEEGSQAN